MTRSTNRATTSLLRAMFAALLALAPAVAAAQDGQFDLRTRTSPSPEPTVVGPVDPDTPTVRTRPRPVPEIVLPPTSAQPSPLPTPAVEARTSRTAPARAAPGSGMLPAAARLPRANAAPLAPLAGAAPPPLPAPSFATPSANPAAPAQPGAYQARDLNVVARAPGIGLWLGLATLMLLLVGGAWMAWSRHFRHRARALPAPVVERPRVAHPARAPAAAPPETSAKATSSVLHLALQATRMSATLVNTTLSYRLVVTNRGVRPLHDVFIAGDMIAAHASRSTSEQLGPVGTSLPELHRIATLAPGESVTLGGDIRLPLVSITPIRRGDAALFVPLARLRGHAKDDAGATVEGGGTFLVGQEPGASKRLQPFRLDLGPRNYSRLGQQLLPAA